MNRLPACRRGFVVVIVGLMFGASWALAMTAGDAMSSGAAGGAASLISRDGLPVNIAHRGARSIAPENTLPAFRIAVERCGAEMIELDVHLSADGVPVVIHDDTLTRTTDVAARFPGRSPEVGRFTAAELLSLDAGRWFLDTDPFGQVAAGNVPEADRREFASGRVRVPTLKQCLQLIRRLGVPVNVELKNFPAYYPRLAEKVLADVRATGMTGQVIFSCFDHQVLDELRRLAPAIPRAALCEQPVYPLGPYLRDALQVQGFNPGRDVLGRSSIGWGLGGGWRLDLLAEAHAAGLGVYVWTVNDPDEMRQLIDAGVDGIFTDFPQVLGPLLAARRSSRGR